MKKLTIILGLLSLNANAQTWNLGGNSGTNLSTDFIGTLDNQSLIFKTNNKEQLKLTPKGRIVVQGIDGGLGWSNNFFFGGGNESLAGIGNYSFGIGSLTSLTSGTANAAFGSNTLFSNTTGSYNSAVGANSIRLFMGIANTALGHNSLSGYGQGNLNTAIGSAAMARYGAVASDIVTANTVIGEGGFAGLLNGNGNTGMGTATMSGLNNGNNNISIGEGTASNLYSGSNNIFIGQGINATSSSISNELNIGNWIIGNNGTIGIGKFTQQLPADGIAQDGEKYKLFVKDGIKTEKVKVDIAASNGWADYVFAKDYKLMSLNELSKFIQDNGHLPEVPTTDEAIKNGIELKEMNILLLKKVEELTLYIIEQQKRIERLEKRIK